MAPRLEEEKLVGTCFEHTGMKASQDALRDKLNGCLALLTFLIGLVGYQIFFQVPALDKNMAVKNIQVEAKIEALQTEDKVLKEEILIISTLKSGVKK